jgi:hypothetical protein
MVILNSSVASGKRIGDTLERDSVCLPVDTLLKVVLNSCLLQIVIASYSRYV